MINAQVSYPPLNTTAGANTPLATITTYDLDGNVAERIAPNGDVTYNSQ